MPTDGHGETDTAGRQKTRGCTKPARVTACEYVGYARASRKNRARKNCRIGRIVPPIRVEHGPRMAAINRKVVIFIPLDASRPTGVGFSKSDNLCLSRNKEWRSDACLHSHWRWSVRPPYGPRRCSPARAGRTAPSGGLQPIRPKASAARWKGTERPNRVRHKPTRAVVVLAAAVQIAHRAEPVRRTLALHAAATNAAAHHAAKVLAELKTDHAAASTVPTSKSHLKARSRGPLFRRTCRLPSWLRPQPI